MKEVLRPGRMAGIAALALAMLAPGPVAARAPAHCDDLAGTIDAALGRDPDVDRVRGRLALAGAAAEDAGNWIGSSGASVYGSWISDGPSDSVGLREYEGGLSLPLRLPGQHAALGDEARALADAAEASEQARRLAVGGAVRDWLWTLAARRSEAALAAHEVEHLGELEALLAARVARGDAAPLELDLARAELADARARFALAAGEVAALEHGWRELTGCASTPSATPEAVPEGAGPTHPGLRLADAEVEAARARHLAERRRPAQAPTLGLLMRRERGAAMAPWIDAVGVNLTVPIGRSGARVRARGEAAAAAAEAEAARSATRRGIATASAAARSRLDAARVALDAARTRRDLAESARDRAHRAWEAGAWDTAELLRVEGLAAEARLAAELAGIALGRATARLNQSLGVLP